LTRLNQAAESLLMGTSAGSLAMKVTVSARRLNAIEKTGNKFIGIRGAHIVKGQHTTSASLVYKAKTAAIAMMLPDFQSLEGMCGPSTMRNPMSLAIRNVPGRVCRMVNAVHVRLQLAITLYKEACIAVADREVRLLTGAPEQS
jgi:hypothetical protein